MQKANKVKNEVKNEAQNEAKEAGKVERKRLSTRSSGAVACKCCGQLPCKKDNGKVVILKPHRFSTFASAAFSTSLKGIPDWQAALGRGVRLCLAQCLVVVRYY